MTQTIHIVVFWVVVIAAVRVAVWFPENLPSRVLFSRLGPVPGRAEAESAYLLRCARFHGSWLAQAVTLYAAGAIANRLDASLAESLAFVVLWNAVIPALAAGALVAALIDLARALRARRRDLAREAPAAAHGAAA